MKQEPEEWVNSSSALLDHFATLVAPAPGNHDIGDPTFDQTATQELQLAGAFQRQLQGIALPIDGLDARVLYQPVGPVSGDLCDIFRLDDSHVAIVVADATGHDVAAAMLSTYVKGLFRSLGEHGRPHRAGDPSEVLKRANDSLLEIGLEDCYFVTAIYAVYNERTGMIRWARAGAPYPLFAASGRSPERIVSDGPLLGAVATTEFETIHRQLDDGAFVTFCTDGLDELATDWWQQPQGTPTAIRHARIERQVRSFTDHGALHDDVTCVTLSASRQSSVTQPMRAAKTDIMPMHIS